MFALVTGYVPPCSSNLFKLIVPSLQIGANFVLQLLEKLIWRKERLSFVSVFSLITYS